MVCKLIVASALFSAIAVLPIVQEKKGAAAPDGAFTIDPVHSTVIFKVTHNGVGHSYGRFNDVSGKLSLDATDPEAAALDLTIQAKSVDTNNADRDKHLRSPDFFNVSEFPTIEFATKTVAPKGKKLEVAGTLKLHGVEKEVTVEAELIGYAERKGQGASVGYEARFSVKRSDFGMKGSLDGISDQVDVIVSLEAGRR